MPLAIRLIIAWAINAAALWVADALFDGVRIHGWWAYIIGAAVLSVEAVERRWALERLLWLDEDRA